MTIPTGLGLVRGVESADPAGTPLPNREVRAAANDSKFGVYSQQPNPCMCGCCNMVTSAH